MGIQGDAMEESRGVPEIFTAPVCRQIQNTDAGGPRTARLPAGRKRRISTLHDAATIRHSVEDVVFPRRRPLGAQAAELAIVVQNCQRLGGSMMQEEGTSRCNIRTPQRGVPTIRRVL